MSGNKIGLALALVAMLLGLAVVVRWYRGISQAQAIRKGHLLAVKAAVREGAPVNTHGVEGVTPLIVAAEAGDLDYVRKLLASGAAVNAYDEHSRSALCWAAESGHSVVVLELLRQGAALQAQEPFDDSWSSPRATAKSAGHQEIAVLLAERERLSRGLLKETQAEWIAGKAATFPATRLVRWRRLLERGASPSWYDINGDSLLAVVAANDLPAVRLMLEFHADPNLRTRMDADVMSCAAQGADSAVLQELLRHGGSIEGGDPWMRPLGCAVAADRLENARILLEHGADPNQKYVQQSLLALSKEKNDAAMTALLRAHGARD